MTKHEQVAQLVERAYLQSDQTFAQWSWKNHVPVVARIAQKLAEKYGADVDKAVAGAWLHDFGDAYVDRHAPEFEKISEVKTREVLAAVGFSEQDVAFILNEVIAPHSCKDEQLPKTLEGKVLATADALAHLTTDFYLQFAWLHLPEGKNYPEFIEWVNGKLDRDFNTKIFFVDEKKQVEQRYLDLKNVYKK